MGARVIGLGQLAAGDDAVGLAVLEELRRAGPPEGTELVAARDAAAVVDLVRTDHRVIIVDAVVGHPRVGEVLELGERSLGPTCAGGLRPLSTHGITLPQALALSRMTSPGGTAAEILIVAIAIAPPERYTAGLSPEVQAAVPAAARIVLAHMGGAASPSRRGASRAR